MMDDNIETVMEAMRRLNKGQTLDEAAKGLGLTRDELLDLVDLL